MAWSNRFMDKEKLILDAWVENADLWIETIGQAKIPSREFTSPAIINCIQKHIEKSFLDIGCGEGWLSRKMMEEGFEVFGLDGTPALIDSAIAKSKNDYFALVTFQEMVNWSIMKMQSSLLDQIRVEHYGGAVLNFCLYQKEGNSELLNAIRKLISVDGKIIVQTIHPSSMISMGLQYKSQWMDDSWKGLSGNFTNGHPWYFRTIDDWMHVFKSSDLQVEKIYEPLGIDGIQPVSIIFVLGTNQV